MLNAPGCMRAVACLLIVATVIPSRAEDEFDPAFRRVVPAGPLEIVPENYPRSEWGTRYVDDVTGYLETHPSDRYTPRLCFDLIMVARELDNRELEHRGLRSLLLESPQSIQARQVLSAIQEPGELLQFIKACLAGGELTAEKLRKLLPVMEFGSQKWGGRLWSNDNATLSAAILASLEFDAFETQTALELEFSQPGQWDRLRLLETLRDENATQEQLMAAIFDSGIDLIDDQTLQVGFWSRLGPVPEDPRSWFQNSPTQDVRWEKALEETAGFFRPELKQRMRDEGADEFYIAVWTLYQLYNSKMYDQFLTMVSSLRKRYPSRRLEWARILTLTNLGRRDEARQAAESLHRDAPQSVWSSQSEELTATFDDAGRWRREQAGLLAAVAEKYRAEDPARYGINVFHDEFRTISGRVVPAGSLTGEIDPEGRIALEMRMGDEVVLNVVLDSDDALRVFAPSFDPSRNLVHSARFYRYATVNAKIDHDPETGSLDFNYSACSNDEKGELGRHELKLETFFSRDQAGFHDFLDALLKSSIYPVSRQEHGEAIEIQWKMFLPFQPAVDEFRWKSTSQGATASVTFLTEYGSMPGGVSLSWGDEDSSKLPEIELPDLPEQVVPLSFMLPRYVELILRSAHENGVLAGNSDREMERFVQTGKSAVNDFNRHHFEQATRTMEVLKEEFQSVMNDFDPQKSDEDEDETEEESDSLLESVFPKYPLEELDK